MSPQNQLHTFNDVCNNESLVSDTETYVASYKRVCVCVYAPLNASLSSCPVPSRSIAKELADWLIHNNVVEHIFGPNLHIEVKRCERTAS